MEIGILGALGIVGLALSAIGGIASFGYNVYQDQRDYPQNLDQWNQMMEYTKESRDQAVQIRARDMEAAGINKRLAAGGSAQVVSPSPGRAQGEQVPGMQIGRGLQDALVGLQARQLKLSQEQTLADIDRLKQEKLYLEDLGYEARTRGRLNAVNAMREQWKEPREQSAESRAQAAEGRAIAAEGRAVQAFEQEIQILRNDVAAGKIDIEQARRDLANSWQVYAQRELNLYQTELENAALQLNMSVDELKRRMIQHDVDILTDSSLPTDYKGEYRDPEHYLRMLFPNHPNVRRTLLPVVIGIGKVFGFVVEQSNVLINSRAAGEAVRRVR